MIYLFQIQRVKYLHGIRISYNLFKDHKQMKEKKQTNKQKKPQCFSLGHNGIDFSKSTR